MAGRCAQDGPRMVPNDFEMAPGGSKMTSIIAPRGFKSEIKKQVPNESEKCPERLDILEPNWLPKWR